MLYVCLKQRDKYAILILANFSPLQNSMSLKNTN